MTAAASSPAAALRFDVALTPPDLSPWLSGNTGLPGFTTHDSGVAGPHVGLVALIHGNEIAGAIVLDRLLRERLRPRRGRLTFGFANLDAFGQFDRMHPTASRFVDEDMNRLWDDAVLQGNRRSRELDRVRAMRPMVESFDILLDLHSMLWPSEPLLLCGSSAKGRALASSIGAPGLVVADVGHASGRRLIDFDRFTDPGHPAAAVLLESGQHWQPDSVIMTEAAVAGLCRHAAAVCPGDPGDHRVHGQFQLCAALSRRRGGAAGGYADRYGRHPGNPHSARRLPADHAQLAPQPRPHGGEVSQGQARGSAALVLSMDPLGPQAPAGPCPRRGGQSPWPWLHTRPRAAAAHTASLAKGSGPCRPDRCR
jgi:hypothetical protein